MTDQSGQAQPGPGQPATATRGTNGSNGNNGHFGTSTTTLDAFYGPNAGYVLELYDRYLTDPNSVDPETRSYFSSFTPGQVATLLQPTNGHQAAVTVPVAQPGLLGVNIDAVVGAVGLANSIREYGHLAVRLDPLGGDPPGAPELDPAAHGISEADLAALPARIVGGPAAEGLTSAQEAIDRLRAIYSTGIGYDFDAVQDPAERAWLRDAVETGQFDEALDAEAKKALLQRLTQVEGFEKFLHQTYLGQKRFSVEGTDIVVPMLDEIIHNATDGGVREIVIGMAHRGRLNVLTHILGKPYDAIIRAFEGGRGKQATAATDAVDDLEITGDVKYHLGAKLARDQETGALFEVPVVLAPNPSHLEFVNPVVVGMVRASQDIRDQVGPPRQDTQASLGILLHGDAAFPGQGVVPETLNLSRLTGYRTGGTIHVIVNNQIGYTTDWKDARSTLYAGDLAKGFEIPILHVNADDPEACLLAARFATSYRAKFGKDFLIDLVGYRRWGHNEGDEPVFTQPLMYAEIGKHPTVRAIWGERLAGEGVIAADEAAALEKAMLDKLAEIRRTLSEDGPPPVDHPAGNRERREVETAISAETLRALHDAIHALPEGFKQSSKLSRQWDRRRALLDSDDARLDWAHAESLAFAAVLADGAPVRLSGQDAERGTFSQRHLVFHDADTGERYVPLQSLPQAKASFAVYNSPLSEAAVVGFEYGYDVHAETVLTLWEAQFGDFANGAQVLIDQFLVAARAKWDQKPALVMLLPHGFEGQGPEHSSARLERFLQLSANDNIRVCNCTTSAQYFHLLRRQAALLDADPHPLIVMTPKSLLRHPEAASPVADFTEGTFRPVIDDPTADSRREKVTRLVLCSGRVYVDLNASPERGNEGVAIVRVEQLAPFQNTALRAVIASYPNLTEIVWLQEEPKNMGAWFFMEPRLRELTGGELPVRYIGRPDRASPAVGSADRHALEQNKIVALAFAEIPARATKGSGPKANGVTPNGTKTAAKVGANATRARKKATL